VQAPREDAEIDCLEAQMLGKPDDFALGRRRDDRRNPAGPGAYPALYRVPSGACLQGKDGLNDLSDDERSQLEESANDVRNMVEVLHS
jgi:hypothetical protein